MNNLVTSHYLFLPAQWMTSAEILIISIILGPGKGISEQQKGQLAQQIFIKHQYILLLCLMLVSIFYFQS